MQASAGERRIHDILTALDYPFSEEYIFDDLIVPNGKHLRFDFAVFTEDGDLQCLIEYQGIQHYQPRDRFGGQKGLYRQRYCDDLKKQYCLKNHIKLICIPYIDEPKLSPDYLMWLIEK